jgi:Zn-dependent protease
MMALSPAQQFVIWSLPVLFAITMHEVAHGWVASKCGDQTAKLMGRLTLNPIKHIDPIGTILVPAVLFALGNFIFGWAKPVPVDARNLQNPRRDMIWVSLAGPLSNFIMAFIWAAAAKIGFSLVETNAWLGVPLFFMGKAGIMINLFLGLLNFIPIPPLDGSKILMSLLPPRFTPLMQKLELYSFLIIVLLAMSGILNMILMPFYQALSSLIFTLFGLP